MQADRLLFELFIVLVSARLLGEWSSYRKIPAVLGELIAGIVIGPSVLGLVSMTPVMIFLSQVAVTLLLFEVGIDTHLGRLTQAGGKALSVAVAGVCLPLILGFCAGYHVLQYSFLQSLFLGAALTATSIGVTLRVFKDLKKQDSQEGQIVLGAAILDDIFGILLLTVLYEFAVSGTVSLGHMAQLLVGIAAISFLSPLLIKALAMLTQKMEEKSAIPGIIPCVVFSCILGISYLCHLSGAPELLGGFLVGIAFSKKFSLYPCNRFIPWQAAKMREFSHKVEQEMKPIVQTLIPIFFVSIGVSLDLRSGHFLSGGFWKLVLVLMAIALVGKIAAGFFMKKVDTCTKWTVGLAMVPRGEMGLVFAVIGLASGVFSPELYAALVFVVILTTLAAPITLRYLYAHYSSNALVRLYRRWRNR